MIFSFSILIVVCRRWHVLVKEKSYTRVSTLVNVRVDVLGALFLLHFLFVPLTSLMISKEYFPVNASGQEA